METRSWRGGLACFVMSALCALLLCACLHHQVTPRAGTRPGPGTDEIKKVVDEIALIEGIPPKSGERQTDKHAAAIVALGKKAGPYLVDKLTDTSQTPVVDGFQYRIGDLALALLDEIYQPEDWPSPDGQIKIPEDHGDYRDYVEFITTPGMRERLKENWKKFIATHR